MVVGTLSLSVPNRRKLLGAAGAALLSSVAGCASIIEETADGPDTSTTEATTTNIARTETTTADRIDSRPNGSDGNVSEPADSAATTADSESLGRIDIDPPKVTFSKSLVSADPGRYEHARLGREEASATATIYGNWKCPYTREFVLQSMDELVEEFVEPGNVALEFRALSYLNGEPFLGLDAPRAARAGLEIWRSAPQRYWSYFASVFTNQPHERYEWATTDRLLRFAETVGVDDTGVEKAMIAGKHRTKVRATTDRAAEKGISTVPRVATSEKVTAPTVDFEATKRQLRQAVDN